MIDQKMKLVTLDVGQLLNKITDEELRQLLVSKPDFWTTAIEYLSKPPTGGGCLHSTVDHLIRYGLDIDTYALTLEELAYVQNQITELLLRVFTLLLRFGMYKDQRCCYDYEKIDKHQLLWVKERPFSYY